MIALINILHECDTALFLFLNGLHCEPLDSVMHTLTGRFFWIPLYIILAVLVVRRLGWRNAILSFLLIALTILIADQICGSVIRPLATRLRPSNLDNPISRYVHIVNDYRGGRFGMASCHAANCFALAVYLIRTMRWRRIAALSMILWALVVTYTRIYLGVHYPGDIIVGAAIGSIIAFCTSIAYFRLTTHTSLWHRFADSIPVIWQRIIRLP